MTEDQLSKIILDSAFKIHTELGPGLFESVYEDILAHELEKQDIRVKKQHPIPVYWEQIKMETGFRADLIIEDKVIIEIKSVDILAPIHHKQLLTYLKITNLKLGLLINFNEYYLKDGIKRIVNKL